MNSDEFLWTLAGDFLDVDAALGAGHNQDLAPGAIEDDAEVEFLGDIDAGDDQDFVDGVSANVHAEDRAGGGVGIVRRARELDAASLAAPTGVDLGLDGDGAAERRAAVAASSGVVATVPGLTGMPWRARISAA